MNHITENDILKIGIKAKEASRKVSTIKSNVKNEIICAAAENLMKKKKKIINENQKDINENKTKLTPATLDRLVLDSKRVDAICEGLIDISKLDDPIGKIIDKWSRPNGLNIEKVSIPLGVIGVIYESRPNVAADAAGAAGPG